MKSKAGFFFVMSCLFFFSACAEVESNPMVVQNVPQVVVGQWAYIGSIAIPGCDGVIHGVMNIEKNGTVSFIEGKDTVCSGNFWSIMTHSGIGTMKINKPEDNADILIAFGSQAVKIVPIFTKKHLRILHLFSRTTNGIFKAVAIRL